MFHRKKRGSSVSDPESPTSIHHGGPSHTFWGDRVLNFLGISHQQDIGESLSKELSIFQLQITKMEELEEKCKSFCNLTRSYYSQSASLRASIVDDLADDKLYTSNRLAFMTLINSIEWALHEFIEHPFVQIKCIMVEIKDLVREKESMSNISFFSDASIFAYAFFFHSSPVRMLRFA